MRRSASDFRAKTSEWWLRLTGLARRVAFAASSGGIWTVLGYETDEGSEEAQAPVFGGIGIYARPGGSSRAEGVLIHIGGSPQHPTIVAIRDEDGRRAYVGAFGDIAAGEVALYPSSGEARILLKADGTVEINSSGGSAAALATKADLDALRAWVAAQFDETTGHTHVVSGGGTTTIALSSEEPDPAPVAAGTSVLKGE